MRLSDSQKFGLELLGQARERASAAGDQRVFWIGAREGISGTTICALADRGLARVTWSTHPYRRLVGKITDEGMAVLRTLREKQAAADSSHPPHS